MYTLLKSAALILLVGTSASVSAQQRIISGKVTSDDGPLPGASVIEKGTSNGTITDIDGTFALSLTYDSSQFVEVSYVGFTPEEVNITNQQSDIEVYLLYNLTELQDIVVVGYGTKKKVNLTGAVGQIESKSIQGKPVANAYQALQGESPGLVVQQGSSEPGSNPQINIRGLSTINGNTPLIVVDGVISSLNNINPSNIASVSVLKDAASASIYGSRAANGVILVTTKSGEEGKPKFSYNTMVGVQQPTNFPRVADSWEYATLRNEALVNSGMAPAFTQEQILDLRENGPNVSHYKSLFKDYAPQSSHDLSMSGASNGLNYFMSLGYLNQSSLFEGPNYGYKRYNFRINLDKEISDKLKVGGRISFVRNDIRDHAWFTEWLIEPTVRTPPIYNVVDEDGNYTLVSGSNGNSLARLETGGERNGQNDEMLGNVSVEYEVLEDLKVKGVLGGNITSNQTHEFRKAIEYVYPGGGDNQNSVADQYARSIYLNPYVTATYNKVIAEDHTLDFLLGASTESYKTNFFGVKGLGVPGNEYGVISNASEVLQRTESSERTGTYGSAEDWAINSFFGRVGYSFANKYLIEGNLRYDGSSRFSSENRWGIFPSVSAGWVLSQESFFSAIENVVSFAKIRASWGKLGNQDINDLYGYQSLVGVSGNTYAFGNVGVPGAYYSVSNANRTWETSTMKNLGIDLSFFDDRLDFALDVFDNLTENILLQLPVPDTYGLGQPYQNAGSVRNRGWEVSVSYQQQTGEVNHSLNLNVSDNLNEIVDLKGREFITGFDVQNILREGYPIYSYYALRSDGLFNSADEIASSATPIFATSVKPGDTKYVDRNSDGQIDYENDRFIVGNPFPRYTFGATYRAEWKGLDFSVFVQGVGKRQQWVRGEIVEAFHNNNEGPVFQQHLDRWTPVNTDATYPRLTVGSESVNNAARSNFWIYDAKYLRVKNAQIGYTLPSALISKIKVSNARIYLTGLNLFTFSPFDIGLDPEVNADLNGGGNASSGRVYPVSRVFSAGLDITF